MTAKNSDICIADVEKELMRLWEAQKDQNRIRASLFNLVIYALDRPRAEYLHEIVATIIEKFPCRIIFIEGNPDPNLNYIKVWVTNAITGIGDVKVACDQINIEVSANQLFRVPFILLPHFIPDLPIFLLWGQDPTTERDILPFIQPYASRLIFDSDCTKNLQLFCKQMLKELDTSKIEIRDMNWAATGSWREIMANVFNNEDKIYQLKNSKIIQIKFNQFKTERVSHPEIQAIYLQGWIAAQMDWKFHSCEYNDDLWLITYLSDHRRITVQLIPELKSSQVPGSINSIEVIGEHLFFISRKDDQPKVVVHITKKDLCEIPFSLPLIDLRKDMFFMQELFYRRTSAHYHKMLALISQLDLQKKQSSNP